jgi:hypothetical protein
MLLFLERGNLCDRVLITELFYVIQWQNRCRPTPRGDKTAGHLNTAAAPLTYGVRPP